MGRPHRTQVGGLVYHEDRIRGQGTFDRKGDRVHLLPVKEKTYPVPLSGRPKLSWRKPGRGGGYPAAPPADPYVPN